MSVKISIVLHGDNNNFRQSLNSILAQSFFEFEVICITNLSSEDVLINEYIQMDQRVRRIATDEQNPAAMRTCGLQAAKGEYVIFLTTNDVLEQDCLLEMYQSCENYNAEIVICGAGVYEVERNYRSLPLEFLNANYLSSEDSYHPEDIADYAFNFTDSSLDNKMFKRALLISEKSNNPEIEFVQQDFCRDLCFVYTSMSISKNISIVRKCLVTVLEDSKRRESPTCFDALKVLLANLKKRKSEPLFRRTYCNLLMNTCVQQIEQAGTEELYHQIYDQVVDACYQLGFVKHGRGYYHIKRKFDIMLDLLDDSVEDAWNKAMADRASRGGHMLTSEYPPCYPDNSGLDGTPVFSVIVPVYNVAQYLGECLDSLIHQTLSNIEIICVNDGSTDKSELILKEYQKKDSRIIVIDQENQGLSGARNTGMKRATGKYIHFVDSDDYLDLRTYEILYNELQKNDVEMLFFASQRVYDPEILCYTKGAISTEFIRCYDYSEVQSGKDLFVSMHMNNEYRAQACMYVAKRAFYQEHNLCFVPGLLHEDTVFTMECVILAVRAKYINIDFYKYRIRDNSIVTSTNMEIKAQHFLKGLMHLCEFYHKYRIDRNQRFADAYIDYCRSVYASAMRFATAENSDAKDRIEEYLKELDFEMLRMIIREIEMDSIRRDAKNNRIKAHQIKTLNMRIAEYDKQIKALKAQASKRGLLTDCLSKIKRVMKRVISE